MGSSVAAKDNERFKVSNLNALSKSLGWHVCLLPNGHKKLDASKVALHRDESFNALLSHR